MHAHRRDTVQSIAMPHWKITLSYDGTPYSGWQVQPGLPTVQGALARAIQYVTGEAVLPQGSGRTDSGVHALAQVAHFPLSVPIPAANLHRALNRALPPSIRILSVEPAPPGFHSRHSATRKTYEYRIFPSRTPPGEPPAESKPNPDTRICPPMLAPYVWDCPLLLDLTTLHQAAAAILGTHDFTSFAASDPDLAARRDAEAPHTPARPPAGNIRTIFHSAWDRRQDLLIYRITGSGFLHHMVRNLVGTFVEAAAGRTSANPLPAILAARNRTAAGPTAPARGLFLVEVLY